MAPLDKCDTLSLDKDVMALLDEYVMAGPDKYVMAGLDKYVMAGLDKYVMAGLDPAISSSTTPRGMVGSSPTITSERLDARFSDGGFRRRHFPEGVRLPTRPRSPSGHARFRPVWQGVGWRSPHVSVSGGDRPARCCPGFGDRPAVVRRGFLRQLLCMLGLSQRFRRSAPEYRYKGQRNECVLFHGTLDSDISASAWLHLSC
jgi:hypothetical protein